MEELHDVERMLLATFTKDNARGLSEALERIATSFVDVKRDMVFVFENKNEHKLILTYDVEKNTTKKFKEIGSTLQLHRKKKFNVFFTLNALNKLLEQKNLTDGKELNWEEYRNSILLMKENELKIIPISFRGIEKLYNYRPNN